MVTLVALPVPYIVEPIVLTGFVGCRRISGLHRDCENYTLLFLVPIILPLILLTGLQSIVTALWIALGFKRFVLTYLLCINGRFLRGAR